MRNTSFRGTLIILAVVAPLTASTANAATYNWNGGTGDWDTVTTNWNGAGTTWPNDTGANSDDAVFGGTAGTVTLITPIVTHNLTFNTTGYTLAGNTATDTLTLDGATPTITLGTNIATTVNSVIDGSVGLTSSGVTGAAGTTSTLTLGGTSANTYTGTTTLNNGIMVLSKSANVAAIVGDISMTNTGSPTLYFTANDQLGGSGLVSFTGGTGNARFNLQGTSQSVAGISSGGNGNSVIQNSEAINGAPSNAGTGTLTLTGSGANSYNGFLRNGSGAGFGILALTKTGAGTQTLSGGNIAYTGATAVNNGTLKVIDTGNFKSSAAIASTATFEWNTTVLNQTPNTAGNFGFTGAGTFVKSGAARLSLSNATPVTTINMSAGGQIDIQGGILEFGFAHNAMGANLGSMNIVGGASYYNSDTAAAVDALTGSGKINNGYNVNTLTLTIGASNTVNNATYGVTSNTAVWSGNIAGPEVYNGVTVSAVNVIKTGTGRQIFDATNGYTGTTLINGGILQIGNAGGTGSLGTGAVTITSPGNLTFNRTNSYAPANTITGTGSLTQAGSGGTTTLTGSGINYSGATAITNGTLALSATTAFNSAVAISPGATLNLTTPTNSSDGWVLSKAITGSGALVKDGVGWVDTTGGIFTNFTGSITINDGVLGNGFANATWTNSTANVTINTNGNFDLRGANAGPTIFSALSGTGDVVNTLNSAGTLQIGVSNASSTFDGRIFGAGGGTAIPGSGTAYDDTKANGGTIALTKIGNGTFTLTGTNTYAGATTISGGVLQIGNAGTTGTLGTGGVTITSPGNLTFNRSDAMTVANALSGTGSLTQAGGGTTTLTNGNSYGVTTISGGVLRIGNAGTTGTLGSGAVTITSPGNLTFDRSNAMTVANAISGSGSLTQAGVGTTTLSNNNSSWTGNITVSGGTLKGSTTNAFGSSSNTRTITVGSGATLEFNAIGLFGGHNVTTVPNIIVNGGIVTSTNANNPLNNITLNSGTLTSASGGVTWEAWNINGTVTSTGTSTVSNSVANGGIMLESGNTGPFNTDFDVQSGTLTVSTNIVDGRATGSPFNPHATMMTKLGNGTMTISGVGSYSGGTTLTAGTLLVNNTAGSGLGSGNVTVNGGILGGTGSFTGAATINSGATLAPGASIESLASGALTMNSSTFLYEALDNSATGADLMDVTGTLSLNSVTLDLSLANLSAGTWVAGDKLTLISYTVGSITSGFTGYTDDTVYTFGSNNWLFNYNDAFKGNNFNTEATGTFVTLTMVPEPSTLAMLLFGSVVLWFVRLKRGV